MRLSGLALTTESTLCQSDCNNSKCVRTGGGHGSQKTFYGSANPQIVYVAVTANTSCFSSYTFEIKVENDTDGIVTSNVESATYSNHANGLFYAEFTWTENMTSKKATASVGIDVKYSGALLASYRRTIEQRGCRHAQFDAPTTTNGFARIIQVDLTNTNYQDFLISDLITDDLSRDYNSNDYSWC